MFEMKGLRADNAQGWMAAVGVLYILDRKEMDVQMLWAGMHPRIFGPNQDQVMDALVEYLERGSDILEHMPPQCIEENKSALDITAGRVELPKVVDKMTNMVNREKILEALTQRWRNQDDIVSLGWDAGAVKLAASIGGDKEPAKADNRGVLAGQWLAAESLPITGTGPRSKKHHWVTWSVQLDLGGVRAVVQSLSADWGGVHYVADVRRNGQMGYLSPARTISCPENPVGSRAVKPQHQSDS